MTVPYADPRSPYHRKQAFDLADVGAGLVANNLSLGCDCLGSITYHDGLISDPSGEPLVKKNAICIHEQDNGIGWKHSNYRTERACVVRNRELVIQQISTVSNYESVRPHAIRVALNQATNQSFADTYLPSSSTNPEKCIMRSGQPVYCPLPPLTPVFPFPGAPLFMTVFSLSIISTYFLSRIDPAIGSYETGNQLAFSECYPMARDDFNPHGNGYVSKTTAVDKPGGLDLGASKSRVYMIQNDQIRNSVNQLPISYKIQVPPMQRILAHPDIYHFKRAEFGDHSIYLTRYQHDEFFSGSKYTDQSRGGDGLKRWAARADNVVDDDIVVGVQFGMNHVPRIEDFPVVPVEILKVALKPVNFFTQNPSMDVPPSRQETNMSKLVSREETTTKGCCVSSTSKL
ncbi:hypothetical protein AbraIFM66950_008809 [Aspergillus brasiliensis]|nr:hypothetical protein AbraIFM66950_008809 [Aspergillus brasiliensis]